MTLISQANDTIKLFEDVIFMRKVYYCKFVFEQAKNSQNES
jgi:hypothetical protein